MLRVYDTNLDKSMLRVAVKPLVLFAYAAMGSIPTTLLYGPLELTGPDLIP